MFQPPKVPELPSMTIKINLSGKYAASHHKIDLVCMVANLQNLTCNKAAYMLTLFN